VSGSRDRDAERRADLRRRAEAVLDGNPDAAGSTSSAETRHLIHELHVTQTELEIQNEELRLAQAAVEQSRNRYETLFHAAPVGYVVLDPVGLIRQANDAFCDMVGLGFDALRSRPLRALVAADHRDDFDRRFPSLLVQRRAVAFEIALAHADGERTVDARLESSAVRSIPGDETLGARETLLVAVSDMTAAKALQKQLSDAEKLQTVGRLAGGIAHDFNNALTVIQNTIEVARWDLEEEHPQRQYLAQIETAAHRSATLVQQLLAFAHKSVFLPRPIDLGQTLAHLRTMLGRLLPESVSLIWDVDADVGSIHADPSQIDQVITNLVLNARDAIDERGTISLRCTVTTLDAATCQANPQARPGPHVAIEIQDDGIGMDAAVRDQIFEPFFTTKPRGEGTGLGLATVHSMVAQNRGIVTVDSRPGAGSCFTVYLPRHEEPTPVEAPVSRAEDRLRGTERLLLVEDDLQILTLVSRQLARKGYEVETFADPAQALTWFGDHGDQVDLVISDVVMPGMSGPAMVERMRDQRPDLPVIFVSGSPENETERAGLVRGDDPLIQKPFDSVTLLISLRRLFDGAAASE
jgi:PAS domain S-box-containing protein